MSALLIDGGVGEAREALVHDGRVIALRVLRQSDEGRRARWFELYAGRVRDIDKRRRGAFVDLGLRDEMGFLQLHPDGRPSRKRAWTGFAAPEKLPTLTEGQSIAVCVVREAARGKSPVLAYVGEASNAPRLLDRHEGDAALLNAKADLAARAEIDAAIEEALSRTSPIPGGGTLTIEPTSALVAIDVDAGGRAGQGDAEKFAFDLNVAAAREAARQVRLRNLGGLVALDFVSMRTKSNLEQLEREVRAAFADDPWKVEFGALSRFGVFELAREQMCTPLHEIMCEPDGRLRAETLALSALRAIEREATGARGREVLCNVSDEAKAWLGAAPFDWRAALQSRIGVRWRLEGGAGARDMIDVRLT
ncbi:MAG: ribonuclease E/G [Pseudomonadota bacterium]